jgi:hypothetical protein
MAARRRIGLVLGLLLIGWTALPGPTAPAAAEPGPVTPVAACSDPDSFGGAEDVGENHLGVERVGAPSLSYRLVARWGRWDGQDLADSAARESGRTIEWGSPRLVLRVREDGVLGVTVRTHEQVVDTAAFAGADLAGGTRATADVDPELLRPRSGGSVYVKVRVERPGLDLATCWAALPSARTLDGAAQTGTSPDFASVP